jgi:hypothetical protein
MRGCKSFQTTAMTRRGALQIGGLSLAGLTLPRLLAAAEARGRIKAAKAKHVIFLHQFGGPSHIDTFDMKPNAPDSIRGEFAPIASSVPGQTVCEHLPRWAQTLDAWAQVRSVNHRMKNHNSACYYSLTGHAPPTDDIRLRDTQELFPAYGSVVSKFLGSSGDGVPAFVSYPHRLSDGSITPGQHASFLGKGHDPYFFQSDPAEDDFSLPELQLPDSITLERLESRRQLLKMIDSQTDAVERMAEIRGMNQFQQQALSILSSPRLKNAFDLRQESDVLRDAYGRTTYGQSCLLARRLIEADVRFVTVYFARGIGGKGSQGWDTHQENFKDLKERLLPITDQTVPTLITDLRDRGLLDETLVLWMGEFGRGPKIGDRDGKGRGHWPECYTVMMAGGGVHGGAVYGASDAQGAYPADNPVGPEDITATLYHALGLDPETEMLDAVGRPFPLTSGRPIRELFS